MFKTKPLISVIVPVFNVEAYLARCVQSILEQSYESIELILVDDGSTDGSGRLCDHLATQDGRISVIHQINGGLSDARNAGLRIARGRYVSFVDSDDYIAPVFLEVLYNACEDAGVKLACVAGGSDFHDDEEPALIESISEASDELVPYVVAAEDFLKVMLYQRVATGAQWRLYNRELLGVDPFPKGLLYEDLATTYHFVHDADTIAFIDCRRLYAYRLRPQSIIRQDFTRAKLDSAILVSRQLYAGIEKWYPDLAQAASSRCFSVLRMVYAQAPRKEREARDALWAELAPYRTTVAHDPNARRRERLAAHIAECGRLAFSLFCLLSRSLGLMK